MANKNVLLINYEYPPLGGGAGNATYHMAREMASLSQNVYVLTSRFSGQPAYEAVNGVGIIRIPVWRRRKDRSNSLEMLTFLVSGLIQIRKIIKQFAITQVVCFFAIPCGPIALYAKWSSGVPYVLSLRGGDVPGFQHKELRYYHRLLGPVIRRVFIGASAVVANSHYLADLASAFEPKVIPRVIPNGVTLPVTTAARVHDIPTLMFAGRWSKQKNVQLLAEMAVLLREQGVNFHLILVGDGPEKPGLLSLIKKNKLESNIELIPWVDRETLATYYARTQVYVSASSDEGMSNSLLEAMAYGLVPVLSDIPGHRELITHEVNGFLVKEPTAAGYTQHIILMSRPDFDWDRIRGNNWDKLQSLTWTAVAEQYEGLLAIS